MQVGAGFIGCIILESFAKNGVDLTVVELGDRMVPRMMTPKAGGIIKNWVENKGVRVVTSAKVEKIGLAGADSNGLWDSIKGIFGGGRSRILPVLTK